VLTDSDLIGIEEIKQLKARYWRAVDTKDFQLLRTVFAAECVVDFRDAMLERDETKLWRDPDKFCEDTKLATQGVITVHHGFPPEISVTSEQEAEGVWPFEDLVLVSEPTLLLPFKRLQGYGYYRDKYRKTTAGWKIQNIYISRVHMECE
jgi:SnoaL-like domain